ncbi:MBL fold metallo-hydrolase [Enterovibrio coralii]|uniref:Hydrolase n=1 Tax=Enterovibrio coralii TaxID=294935 RepID=A0A135IDP5_9GAMM|nr:MBL fold metallo-hydrolase [Enterovibrio coralii]KXF83464.1 hydrolase [Enterovibrio coralii]
MATSLLSCSESDSNTMQYPKKFTNSDPEFQQQGNLFEIIKAYFRTERQAPKPTSAIPLEMISVESLASEQSDVVYRLGHSSIAMKVDGQLILADPVFSDRASPVQFFGPKRFHEPPIKLAEMPNIDVVIISHDHYDHLDKATVKELADKVGTFLVPLRVGQRMVDWGIPQSKVVELNWWDAKTVNGIEFVFTPTQHFSGRGVMDGNTTLWGSWVINSANKRIFFSGDSGYFSGFKEIGDKYGPFDLTMIETGAYNALWSNIHMFPEQSVQAHIDLRGKVMMPIHNSTFDLALHDWYEPLEQALEISAAKGVAMVSPVIGQKLAIGEALPITKWWREEDKAQQ